MKRMVMLLSILLLGSIFLMADAISITITQPTEGIPLIKNDTQIITWTHSSHFNTYPQNCRIFFGSHPISPPIPVTACSFSWTVGQKADGTYIPQGLYKLTIESPDYDALNGPDLYLVDEDASISITAPPNNKDLVRGQTYNITWTCTAYYQVIPQTCTVYCGENPISPPISTLAGSFTWTVGQKHDGTTIPDGRYQIVIESDDHDEFGPYINLESRRLKFHKGMIPRYAVSKVPIIPIPHCPRCFKIDPVKLKINPEFLTGPVTVEIMQGNRLVAKLGKFSPGKAMPGPVQIKLTKEQKLAIKNRQAGYRLRILSADGRVLQENAVQLVVTR